MAGSQDWPDRVRTTQYEKAVEFQLNEMPGKFIPLVGGMKPAKGEKIQITDRFSDVNAVEITSRHSKTEFTDMEVERRWIHKPNRSAIHLPLDPDDEMATEVDLNSPLPMAIARGIRRYQDDQILVGFYGNAYIGDDGTTAVGFKAGNVIAADYGETATTYVGLTLKKLRRVIELYRTLLVDLEMERPHMAITAADIDDLLQISEYIGRDFNPDSQSNYKPMSGTAKQALQDGKPTPFLGIVFVPAEITNAKAYPKAAALAVNGTGHRRLPVWVPSGMDARSWLDFEAKRDPRPDLNHTMQYSGYSASRAARVHEDKCIIVETL